MRTRHRGPDSLTASQRAVLGLVAHGRSTRDMALILGVSQSTIKWHCGRLLRYYEVNRRSALVVVAIAAGDLDAHASLETAVKGAVHHRPRQGGG